MKEVTLEPGMAGVEPGLPPTYIMSCHMHFESIEAFMSAWATIGEQLGGHNVQVVGGVPDRPRYGLDEDVAMWLPSGWWLTFRNQFAQAPDVAREIVDSVVNELSRINGEANAAQNGLVM